MTDWEARMTERAHEWQSETDRQERASQARTEDDWHAEHDTTVEAYVDRLATERPELVDWISPPCACLGAPGELWHLGDYPPCYCALSKMARDKLRAAR